MKRSENEMATSWRPRYELERISVLDAQFSESLRVILRAEFFESQNKSEITLVV